MGQKYLTFDCYGTLVDWRAGIEKELVSAMGNIGVRGQALLDAYVESEKEQESNYKKYREVLALTAKALSPKLGVGVSDSAAAAFGGSVPRWPAFSDSREFLHRMGERGYRRYILSNVDTDLLQETIRNHNFEVDGFVTAEEVGSYKPAPGHWSRFLEKTGAKREEVLHVAQSVFHDIVPTQGMGIKSAWVNRYQEKLPGDVEPQYVCDTLAHLAELLD